MPLSNSTAFVRVLLAFLGTLVTPSLLGGVTTEGSETSRPSQEDRAGWAIKDEDSARADAQRVLGGDVRGSAKMNARLVIIHDDNTPFLEKSLPSRAVWHVVFDECRVAVPFLLPGATDEYSRTFDVFLDPQNGALLKAESRWPEGVAQIPPEPGAAAVAEQMRRSGREKYHSFVPHPPPIHLSKALEGVVRGGGNPLVAKQIKAQYVMWSRGDAEPKAVWAITLRGVPPFPAAFPGVPEDARNHRRYIIDGETGEWLCASSVPQPEADQASEERRVP